MQLMVDAAKSAAAGWHPRGAMEAEAEYLLATSRKALGRADKIRLMGWPAPIGVFFYTLFVKGCLFDGWPGWFYALQRRIGEMLLALEILEHRLWQWVAKHNALGRMMVNGEVGRATAEPGR